ncbi:sigma-70 family RNA polymerase sigma factor [Clostridium sp. 'White wine YQ']|uniref:sigma-70 family RNA polymerase sigma factor n=1 Tax=Clostridium sp. 'White wine YQ' TaxID=3027474 RepID=UPI0023664808|nr:sigma-70 family RNA polymerase sigma factor [Clostridium sp. 'White wine YQ']MDD7795155.1 sigma-70 family RNA polymerase sigma factor [Clostridium sp. 'White wine YQ']
MDLEKKIAQAVKGDEEAFNYIIKLKNEDLYRTAYAFVKNKDDALDILQETVYKAYISIEKLRKPQYFNTWLTRILINNCKNFIRNKEKIIYLEDNKNCNEDITKINIDERLDLFYAIDKLEEKHRMVIILKYFQDLTINQIAESLGYPIGTVKTYLNKGLSQLRIYVGKEII